MAGPREPGGLGGAGFHCRGCAALETPESLVEDLRPWASVSTLPGTPECNTGDLWRSLSAACFRGFLRNVYKASALPVIPCYAMGRGREGEPRHQVPRLGGLDPGVGREAPPVLHTRLAQPGNWSPLLVPAGPAPSAAVPWAAWAEAVGPSSEGVEPAAGPVPCVTHPSLPPTGWLFDPWKWDW